LFSKVLTGASPPPRTGESLKPQLCSGSPTTISLQLQERFPCPHRAMSHCLTPSLVQQSLRRGHHHRPAGGQALVFYSLDHHLFFQPTAPRNTGPSCKEDSLKENRFCFNQNQDTRAATKDEAPGFLQSEHVQGGEQTWWSLQACLGRGDGSALAIPAQQPGSRDAPGAAALLPGSSVPPALGPSPSPGPTVHPQHAPALSLCRAAPRPAQRARLLVGCR